MWDAIRTMRSDVETCEDPKPEHEGKHDAANPAIDPTGTWLQSFAAQFRVHHELSCEDEYDINPDASPRHRHVPASSRAKERAGHQPNKSDDEQNEPHLFFIEFDPQYQ